MSLNSLEAVINRLQGVERDATEAHATLRGVADALRVGGSTIDRAVLAGMLEAAAARLQPHCG